MGSTYNSYREKIWVTYQHLLDPEKVIKVKPKDKEIEHL